MDVTPFLSIVPAPAQVLRRAALHPERPRFQVRGKDGSWTPTTWAAFARELRAVARWLIDHDFRAGDVAAIYAHNSVAWAAAALGIQAAGGVMMPVYPASTAEQVQYALGHAPAKVVFVSSGELAGRVQAVQAQLPALAHVLICDGDSAWASARTQAELDDAANPTLVDARLAAIDLDAPGLLLYTSGTSGHPKGVPLSHTNVGVNAADWLRNHAEVIDEHDVDLLWLPMSHIFGFGEMGLGNTLGWTSYMVPPGEAIKVLPEVRPHVFMSVPAYWEKIARAVDAGVAQGVAPAQALATAAGDRLRFGLSGGAGLGRDVKETLRTAGLVVIEGYGLTETSPTLTLNHPRSYRFDSVGKPLPSVQLMLAEDGEILAKGPNVFRGYLHDPEATRGAFTDDGWFKTGDVGRWTEDGFLQIVDRKKDILVTAGGKNVPPANIEARFATSPGIERVVVYGDARPYLVAGVWVMAEVPEADRERLVAAEVERINGELAKFETIKKFWISTAPLTVESGLVTASLKVKRKAVYEHFRAEFEGLYK